jgi:hypothetical protein
MSVAFDSQTSRALRGGDFGKTYMAEFGKTDAEIAKAERVVRVVGIKFCK